MSSKVTVKNSASEEVEVLVTDSKGGSNRSKIPPGVCEDIEAAPGEVFVKLFSSSGGSVGGGMAFGMALMTADLATCTVQSGSQLEIIAGARGPVFKRD